MSQVVTKFIFPSSTFFGLFIFGVNIKNYKQSPIYKPFDNISKYRIGCTSVVKGIIYGSTFPYSLGFVLYDAVFNEKRFRHHLVSNSVYK